VIFTFQGPLSKLAKEAAKKALDPVTIIFELLQEKKYKCIMGMLVGFPDYAFGEVNMLHDVLLTKTKSIVKATFN
jgi:hypothetical protein